MSRGRADKRKRRAATPPEAPAPVAAEAPLSAWTRLSRGSQALVALVATTAVAAVVPGVIPYLSDRALDLVGVPVVDVDAAVGPHDGDFVAATEAIPELPGNPAADPRFVPAGKALTGLSIEGRRAAGVTLVGMSTEIVERKPIRTGTVYGYEKGGPGENTVVVLNLDSVRPVPVVKDSSTPYFTANHISLARGELALITLDTSTKKCECAWRLHLTLRYRGENQKMVIPPADEAPFRMTAFAAPADYQVMQVPNEDGQTSPVVCADQPGVCARTRSF